MEGSYVAGQRLSAAASIALRAMIPAADKGRVLTMIGPIFARFSSAVRSYSFRPVCETERRRDAAAESRPSAQTCCHPPR